MVDSCEQAQVASDRGGYEASLISSTWIIIAAFHEGTVISEVVSAARKVFTNVVVVDDGSTDFTSLAASAAGATVIRHCINLGQGAALQTGIDYALLRGASYVATFDADGQHCVEDLVTMLRQLDETGADVALGSRFLGKAEGIDPLRKRVLQLGVAFQRFTTGARLTDAHNGLRMLRASAAKKIRLRQNRMAHASEFIANIIEAKLNFVEVPCTIRYTGYSKEKGQKLSGAIQIVLDLAIKRMYR